MSESWLTKSSWEDGIKCEYASTWGCIICWNWKSLYESWKLPSRDYNFRSCKSPLGTCWQYISQRVVSYLRPGSGFFFFSNKKGMGALGKRKPSFVSSQKACGKSNLFYVVLDLHTSSSKNWGYRVMRSRMGRPHPSTLQQQSGGKKGGVVT